MGTFEYLGLMETDPKGWLNPQFSRVQVVSLRMVIFGKLQDRGAFYCLIANGFGRVREKEN